MTIPWATLAILAVAAAGMAAPQALGYAPDGPWWSLVTCQLAHWDLDHALWDMAAVALLGAAAEVRHPGPTRLAMVLALLLIPPITIALHPNLAFRGLSGVACALAAVLAVRERLPWLLALVVAKAIYEWTTGDAVFASAAGWIPLPVAHLAGAACGLLAVLPAYSSSRLLRYAA
jgi:membrane associated rhomboid family serine protease